MSLVIVCMGRAGQGRAGQGRTGSRVWYKGSERVCVRVYTFVFLRVARVDGVAVRVCGAPCERRPHVIPCVGCLVPFLSPLPPSSHPSDPLGHLRVST